MMLGMIDVAKFRVGIYLKLGYEHFESKRLVDKVVLCIKFIYFLISSLLSQKLD